MKTARFRQVPHRNASISLSVNERLSSDHLIVAIHGLGCSKESFDGLFLATGLNSYSICAVDLPGHGDSDRPDDFEHSMDEYARVVSSVISQIAPTSVSIVAHSMGGAVGVLLAEHHVDVECFSNIEGNLVAEDCSVASRRIAEQTSQQFVDDGYREFVALRDSSNRADLQTWSRWLRQASPRALHQAACSLIELSDSGTLLNTFNALGVKIYVHGDEDSKDFLLHRLQRAPVTAISNAGHFSMIDNPVEFEAAVVKGMTRGTSVVSR